MHALYADGATLEEVGARFGVTRERVHQIFREAGIRTRSKKETAALRRERLLRQHSEKIRVAFSESKDVEAVSRQLNVPQVTVRAVVERHFPSAIRPHPKKARPPVYSSSELIVFLQEAATAVSGKLTTGTYAKYAEGRHTDDGRRWPSFQTHAKRFGGWRRALERAAINRPPARATSPDDEASRD